MKKILYFVDYRPNVYNSVTEMLHNILKQAKDTENVVVVNGYDYEILCKREIDGVCTVFGETVSLGDFFRDKSLGFREKCYCLSRRFLKYLMKWVNEEGWVAWSNKENFSRVIKMEKPDMVCFMIWHPCPAFVKVCRRNNVEYMQILYDTFLNRPDPGWDNERVSKEEPYVIRNAKAYFVPSFFFDGYIDAYGSTALSSKIQSYNLPLLVKRENVLKAVRQAKPEYDFTYFGQIQSFRNADKIEEIFRSLHLRLDVFTATKYQGDEIFKVHKAVAGEDLWKTVAESRFLVAFDNAYPYNHFLPSKVYLYVSFTKPIIVFGDNAQSALKDFLCDYPLYYYQNIHEPTDGLVQFIQSINGVGFDEKIYSKYEQYLPENALKPVMDALS